MFHCTIWVAKAPNLYENWVPKSTPYVQERKLIASVTVDEILSLNSLDVELYKHAEKLYAKQEKFLLSTMQPQVLF